MNWFHNNFDLDVEILFKIKYSDFLGNFNRHWTLPLFYWLLCTLVHILYWIKRQKYVIYRCWKPLLWVLTFAVSLYFSKGVIHFLWFGLCSSYVMLCKQTSSKLSGLKQTTFCLWIYNLARSWRGSLSLIHLMSALAEAWNYLKAHHWHVWQKTHENRWGLEHLELHGHLSLFLGDLSKKLEGSQSFLTFLGR